jgi:hypothetical protein
MLNSATKTKNDDVSVAVGEDHAPLVGVDGDEPRRVLEQVGHLLKRPPVIIDAEAVVVVADADPVEGGGVQPVPLGVLEQTIAVARSAHCAVGMRGKSVRSTAGPRGGSPRWNNRA